MNPDQAAAASRKAVSRLGPAFLLCPRTLRRARQLGLTGWACYVAGRGGALGEVRPATVAAAFGLIAPEAVRDGWISARLVLPPAKVAAHMLAECCRWGAEKLDDAPKVARLAALTEAVAGAADATSMPLFAAWRAMPVPSGRATFPAARAGGLSWPVEGPGARAAIALHLLAEHRAAATLVGIKASGLTPLQALVSGPEGEAAAAAFGWPPPYPKPGPLLRRRAWADSIADHIEGQALTVLAARERIELITLLNEAQAYAGLS